MIYSDLCIAVSVPSTRLYIDYYLLPHHHLVPAPGASATLFCFPRDIVPLGKARSQWNFCLEDKRVLNMVNVVSDEDNVKQDISIDVYGRQKKEEVAAALAADKVGVGSEFALPVTCACQSLTPSHSEP